MSSALANEGFNEGQVLEMSKDIQTLFKKPSVREEEVKISGIPHALNVSKVSVEVHFNNARAVFIGGWFVISCEAFSEYMCTLVMFVFEFALPQDCINIFNLDDFMSIFLEVSPHGIVFGGS